MGNSHLMIWVLNRPCSRQVAFACKDMEEQFEIRDNRRKEMFRVDDEYLNGYSKLCGANATLVYLCLCRHSDRNQESFPSVQMMAEKTGISRDSVMRGIKKLVEWNIILKERERKEDAKWLNNRYTLLDKSVWKSKPSSIQQHGKPSRKSDLSQVANEGVSQVAHSDTKVTHRKVTHIRLAKQKVLHGNQWNELIDSFKDLNPLYEDFYRNKTERAALEHLAEKIGYEKLLATINALPEITKKPYAPKITKPSELQRDLGKLITFYKQQQNTKITKSTPNFIL